MSPKLNPVMHFTGLVSQTPQKWGYERSRNRSGDLCSGSDISRAVCRLGGERLVQLVRALAPPNLVRPR
jgi:hypothetical protein